ncbi:hypothetical protein F66182_3421 [Fusarium sp. NRRL 66182]|nr:hypothetical protein F66182_3421 [Fusarium sp. NRRL 66182]
MTLSQTKPILIIGAGISGLLLAQNLAQHGISARVFERDMDLETRGLGWGLTLHWSLPALKSLLPEHLVQRLPEAYVDRLAVEGRLSSTFPFFDLSTGELKASTPRAPEADRIRVTRKGLRDILATGIHIEWDKALSGVCSTSDSVTATFEDGSSATGCLLIACDGAGSRVRRALFPDWQLYQIPVRMLGVKLALSCQQIKPIRDLDPFFLQGTHSKNDTFVYVSLLDSPGNHKDSPHPYVCQMCVSWPYREGFFNSISPIELPATDEERHSLVRGFAESWAEPFRSLAMGIPASAEWKGLKIQDLPPSRHLRTTGRAVLMGDAFHATAMYRGEGANHAILDVQDLVDRIVPILEADGDFSTLRSALDEYEHAVASRARPGVLASRQACLDAHDWKSITSKSPLLTRRTPFVAFDEKVGLSARVQRLSTKRTITVDMSTATDRPFAGPPPLAARSNADQNVALSKAAFGCMTECGT